MEQIQKQKTHTATEETVDEMPVTDSKEALKKELDDLLDEIDSVLIENAEEFVRNYRQKGGE